MTHTTLHPHEIIFYAMQRLTIKRYVKTTAHHIESLLHITMYMGMCNFTSTQVGNGYLRYRTTTFSAANSTRFRPTLWEDGTGVISLKDRFIKKTYIKLLPNSNSQTHSSFILKLVNISVIKESSSIGVVSSSLSTHCSRSK